MNQYLNVTQNFLKAVAYNLKFLPGFVEYINFVYMFALVNHIM